MSLKNSNNTIGNRSRDSSKRAAADPRCQLLRFYSVGDSEWLRWRICGMMLKGKNWGDGRRSLPSESTIGVETPATGRLLHAQPNLALSGYFEVTGMEGVDRIHLAHGRDESRGIVNRVLIRGVVQNAGNIVYGWGNVSFERKLPDGVLYFKLDGAWTNRLRKHRSSTADPSWSRWDSFPLCRVARSLAEPWKPEASDVNRKCVQKWRHEFLCRGQKLRQPSANISSLASA
jgi:hypothetical protein